MAKKKPADYRPVVNPPSPAPKGMSDKKRLQLVEIDGNKKRVVKSGEVRKANCVYIYEEVVNAQPND